MCNQPCSLCGDYSECKIFYENSRCRSCKHDNEDVLTSCCKSCQGFDLMHKDCLDLYEAKDGI